MGLCRWLTGIGATLMIVAGVLLLAVACSGVPPTQTYRYVPGTGVVSVPAPRPRFVDPGEVVPGRGVRTIPAPGPRGGPP